MDGCTADILKNVRPGICDDLSFCLDEEGRVPGGSQDIEIFLLFKVQFI